MSGKSLASALRLSTPDSRLPTDFMRAHEHHETTKKPTSLLGLAAALTGATFVVELAGGLWANSVALLSDAGHVFMDLTALLFSLSAMRLAARPTTDRRTFGLHRLEVFAAFINGLLVIGLALWIVVESASRLGQAPPVKVDAMLAVAAWGLAVNLFVAWRLHGHVKTDLNVRGAFLHVAGDAVASIGVIAGGLLMRFTGYLVIDPLTGLFVACIILVSGARLVKDSVEILLEGVPKHLDLNEVVRTIRAVPGVAAVEDTHVWSICSHICSLSAHITLPADRMADQKIVVESVNAVLRERFSIVHSTLQVHSAGWK